MKLLTYLRSLLPKAPPPCVPCDDEERRRDEARLADEYQARVEWLERERTIHHREIKQ